MSSYIDQSNRLLPELNEKRIQNLVNLGGAYSRLWRYNEALIYFNEALSLSKQLQDSYWIAHTSLQLIDTFAVQGNWRGLIDTQSQAIKIFSAEQQQLSIVSELLGHWCIALAWAGRYRQAEGHARQWLRVLKEIGEQEYHGALRDLGFSLGIQENFHEAYLYLKEAVDHSALMFSEGDASGHAFWGVALTRQGNFAEAKYHFNLLLEHATKVL